MHKTSFSPIEKIKLFLKPLNEFCCIFIPSAVTVPRWAVAALLSTFTAELPFPLRAAAVIMWGLGDRTGNYTGIRSHQPLYVVFAMQKLEEGVLNYLVKYMTGETKLNNSCFLHWFPVPCCCWLQCVSGHCFVTSYFAFLNQFAFLLAD